MHRMKSTARCQHTDVASSSSSEEDISLRANHNEASAPTCDAGSFSVVSQRRGGVSSQQDQFTSKYLAQWNDDLSM